MYRRVDVMFGRVLVWVQEVSGITTARKGCVYEPTATAAKGREVVIEIANKGEIELRMGGGTE